MPSIDLALVAPDELGLETVLEEIEAPRLELPRVKAPLPPEFGQCCYPIGEPRAPGFHFCAAPVAQQGAPYCLEHKRLCHVNGDEHRRRDAMSRPRWE